MQPVRRLYRRESEESRRSALISATQELVAEGGPEAATVRAIAARAGVTPGLIRHYFQSKDELTRAAYRALMDGMTAKGSDALEGVGAQPEERLAAFVAASLRPPVLDAGSVVLWAGYMHKVRSDPELLAVHEAGYLAYRDALQHLIEALPRKTRPGQTPVRGHRLQRADRRSLDRGLASAHHLRTGRGRDHRPSFGRRHPGRRSHRPFRHAA